MGKHESEQDKPLSEVEHQPRPLLIAHRGYSGRYPENTLLAYQAAHQHGAVHFELDVQLSADRVPFLHHDASLLRMADVDKDIRDVKAKEIKSYSAAYAQRFGDEFSDNQFTTLKKFCKWVSDNPSLFVFVEIKQESINRFGIPVVVDEVLKRILSTDVQNQCSIISFNHEVIDYVRKVSSLSCGWVLPEWNDENHTIAMALNPEYLFCDKDYLPSDLGTVWSGSWQWVLYNLDTVESAMQKVSEGFHWLETNEIGTLLASKDLMPR
ncbi:MAG: glycerophosphodiester phosphodiesterase family protein [Pseudomonadota bacterium]